MTQGKFIIIDGNSLVYRAFYALPLLKTTTGVYTNAVYGFTTMLMKVLNEEKPACLAIAFDKGKTTFRNEHFEDYKGHRKATPDELKPQFPLVKEIVRAFRIPVYEIEGYEADDIIGTVSLKAEEMGYETVIVTGDRDALQLVSPKTRVMLTKKGISEMELYDENKVAERYGLKPAQIIDMKGLMGDTSDNIPGVPGIGEKTAAKLVREYGSVEELLAQKGTVAGKLREKLEQYAQQALLSKKLATIIRHVPIEIDLRECVVEEPDYAKLLELGRSLEFKALTKLAQEKAPEQPEKLSEPVDEAKQLQINGGYRQYNFDEALTSITRFAEQKKDMALVLRTSNQDPWSAVILGLAWSAEPGSGGYLAGEELQPADKLTRILDTIFWTKGRVCFHDAKRTDILLRRLGNKPVRAGFDTMLAAYLLDPSVSNLDLAALSIKYLGQELRPGEDYTSFCAQADIILRLVPVLHEKLAELNMLDLYFDVEMPLLHILANMEFNGVKLDKEYLEAMSVDLSTEIDRITGDIYRLAGEEFNINSTRQLGTILFEKLGLPVIKKTKTGYSTDVEVLETLAERHEVVARVLHYRQLVKLKSTYVDGLIPLINPVTGKVHTTFNQTVTATGRLSSTEPNLQNIPIRMEEGRRIRKAFVPSEPGWIILSADYSQIELRILAHLSGDERFVQAFRNDEDIHTRTAAEVFGVSLEEVTGEMRSRAKAVNFGIVYGISDFGLAKNISVSRKEARQYIENYFARYAGIKKYLEETVGLAREQGYVTTLLNRRRYLPDILSPNRNIRSFGERTAMNTPIQGSAADIIKLAMVRVADCLKKEGLKARMLLQVHDELIFEAPPEELPKVTGIVRECMENAVKLTVPLKVDMKKGFNWYDMEKIND
ncbi:DNA polymerase I [Thermincola ferriacetica]